MLLAFLVVGTTAQRKAGVQTSRVLVVPDTIPVCQIVVPVRHMSTCDTSFRVLKARVCSATNHTSM
jgi:hypothetical protein